MSNSYKMNLPACIAYCQPFVLLGSVFPRDHFFFFLSGKDRRGIEWSGQKKDGRVESQGSKSNKKEGKGVLGIRWEG